MKPKKPNRTQTEPNQKTIELKQENRSKPEKTELKPRQNKKKQAKLEKTELKPGQNKKTESDRFEPVFVLKNQIEPKSVSLKWFRFF